MNLIQRVSSLTLPDSYKPPSDTEQPLSFQFLQEQFEDTLPLASVSVWFEWYPNTADVLLAGTDGDTVDELNNWSLRLIAVHEPQVSRVRELLVSEGIPLLRDWFCKCDHFLQANPARWIGYSLVIRFENNTLQLKEKESWRPSPRPEPGWPQGPYIPHR